MSDYDKRYNLSVHPGSDKRAAGVSLYADTLTEARATLRRYEARGYSLRFITEGYADYEDVDGGAIVTRRTIGPVPAEVLDEGYPDRVLVRQEARDAVRQGLAAAFPGLPLPAAFRERYAA